MKAYPIIYSRTKYCEYVPEFLVRPRDFDYDSASKYVGQALEELKRVGGMRHMVFSVGEYLVYGGIACITSEIVKRILLEKKLDELDYDYKDYQRDQVGRQNTFFIGFGIRRCDVVKGEIPEIDLYDTYKIYLEFLKKQWFAPSTATQILDIDEEINIGSTGYKEEYRPEIMVTNGKNLVRNFDENNYQLMINYFFDQMCRGRENESSFLSHVLPADAGTCTHFENISIFGISAEDYAVNYGAGGVAYQEQGGCRYDNCETGKMAREDEKIKKKEKEAEKKEKEAEKKEKEAEKKEKEAEKKEKEAEKKRKKKRKRREKRSGKAEKKGSRKEEKKETEKKRKKEAEKKRKKKRKEEKKRKQKRREKRSGKEEKKEAVKEKKKEADKK